MPVPFGPPAHRRRRSSRSSCRPSCAVGLAVLVAVACALLLVAVGASRAAADGPARRWVAPLDGPLDVVRPFEPPATRWGPGHRGVDLGAFDGAIVGAAGAGTVTYAGTLAGRGVVTVTHGALRTTYEPVDPLVVVGEHVSAGEAIAMLEPGHAGTELPDAVLHWGLLRGETYLDPLLLLGRGPARLVPVPPAAAPPAASLPAGPLAAPPRRASLASPSVEVATPPHAGPTPVRSAAAAVAVATAAAFVRRRRAGPRPPPVSS